MSKPKRMTKTEARKRIRRAARAFVDELGLVKKQSKSQSKYGEEAYKERDAIFGEWLFGVYWGLRNGLKDYKNLYDINDKDMN